MGLPKALSIVNVLILGGCVSAMDEGIPGTAQAHQSHKVGRGWWIRAALQEGLG